MKKIMFFTSCVLLVGSFFLSGGKNTLFSSLSSSVFHFLIFGHLAMFLFYPDFQEHIFKPDWFDIAIVVALISFGLSMLTGFLLSKHPNYLCFFSTVGGALIGFFVGGVIAHKTKSKKIYNYFLYII